MKRTVFILLAAMASMPLGLLAQKAGTFKVQYVEQATENAASEAKVSAALLRKKYAGDAAMEQTLYKVLYERKLAVIQVSARYAGTPELESRLAEVIAKNDSLVDVYVQAAKDKGLANNKVLRPDDISKFASAIRLKNDLGLTGVQIDSLMYHTNRIAELRIGNAGFNPKEYERKMLPKILTDQQYTSLLVNMYKPKAIQYAQNDWREFKGRGLLPGADSTKTLNEMIKYNISKWAFTDRYEGTDWNVSAAMKAIEVPEPQAIKLLKTARRYNNPIPAQASKPEFKW